MSHRLFILFLFTSIVFPIRLFAVETSKAPVRVDPVEIEDRVSAHAYVVIDRASGELLTVKQEHRVWPIASLTKLMTAQVVLESNVSPRLPFPVLSDDDVGGAKLYIKNGDRFTIDDLFYAMLSGSANNAANALSRASKFSPSAFVDRMNARAKELGLLQTSYADTSGMDLGNMSTPLEMAKVAEEAFSNRSIQRYVTTQTRYIRNIQSGEKKKITTTNWMLYKSDYDDVYVTGGKTGYLHESGWNLALTVRPNNGKREKELLIIVFGAESRDQLFKDANTLAHWAWRVYDWK